MAKSGSGVVCCARATELTANIAPAKQVMRRVVFIGVSPKNFLRQERLADGSSFKRTRYSNAILRVGVPATYLPSGCIFELAAVQLPTPAKERTYVGSDSHSHACLDPNELTAVAQVDTSLTRSRPPLRNIMYLKALCQCLGMEAAVLNGNEPGKVGDKRTGA